MYNNAMPRVVNQFGTMKQGGMMDKTQAAGITPMVPTEDPDNPDATDPIKLRLAAMMAALQR